jgi:uncharacterized protein YndB with AHSA1/START domain
MSTTTAAPTSTDRIVKEVILDATRSRVWRALTDVKQFNAWFGANVLQPFSPGAEVSGNLTFRNWEHVTLTMWIERMDAEHFFSFRWHPYPIQEGIDLTKDPTTLVTFTLEDAANGTRLTIVESGFDALPESRRATAFNMNSGGWNGQSENLRRFLEAGVDTTPREKLPHEQ